MVSVCQIDPTKPIMINSTDSLLHHTVPITVSDSFSVIEIREIPEPIVNKHSINGKRVLTGTIILQSKKNKSFFRHNQIFFIRLKKKNTVYGVISIAKKKKGEISRNNNIIPNQSYFFTIKPYNKENIIPNEKIFLKLKVDGVTFIINSQELFIENIYITNNLDGLEYLTNP